MNKSEAERNKYLLKIENVLIITNLIQFLAVYLIVPFYSDAIPNIAEFAIMALSMIALLVSVYFALKIETEVGYYECGNCKNRYVPAFRRVLLAPHMGRTRYMECPSCHAKTWQHKFLTKN